MSRKLTNLLIYILILCGGMVQGLDPAKTIPEYNLERYTTENGLPQSSVLAMVQTADGYLWLATYEGLTRFDGIHFQVFDTTNTPEIESNRIKTLLEDSKRNLWIGTSSGLLLYRGGIFKNYTTKNGLSDNFILSLCEDGTGRVWIGTTNGLNCFDHEGFTSYAQARELSSHYISSLTADQEGNLHIGTDEGLYSFNLKTNTIKRCNVPDYPRDLDIRTLYQDKQGRLWIGTAGKGLMVAEKDKCRAYTPKDGLSGTDVRAIFQDANGTLWIGTNGQGLNTFKNGIFSYSDSEEGFFSSPIRAILEDREGSLWIGTRDGLSQLKDGKFIIYNKRNGLPVDTVRTVFQDDKGYIWIGTVNGGLVKFKDNRFKWFGIKEGLRSEHVWTIAQGKDGSIWFGTYGGGLHRLKDDRITAVYMVNNGLSSDIIRAVCLDGEDNVWIGTNGGGVDVIKKEGNYKTIINYSTKNGLSNDFVYAVAVDNRGTTWIGAYNGDLNRFKDGKITAYGSKEGLSGDAIWSIYPDENGAVWIGTDGGGLQCFSNNRFTRYTTKDGLYSDLAFQVFEDRQGNLWMNGNKGIYYVNKKELLDFSPGKIPKITCRSFGKAEGLKATECAGPAQPAGIFTSEGKVWFPTIHGALTMDPQNTRINKIIPPVLIEEVRADGALIYAYPGQNPRELYLSPGKKRLTFKYTCLSFTDPQQVKFKYRLAGFDDEWIDAPAQRQVTYTNIRSGDYSFQVIACNSDGVWNTQGARFSFTLKPFFWQTWWFGILFLFAFAILSYLVINFIKNHLKLIAFWKKKKYIGSYEIDEQIGVGGMGVVYRVHSLMDRSKIFAMKVMKEEYLADEIQKKRFKNESLLVDRLEHPHIVKVYERGQHGEMLYIVMELLEGENLSQRFKENRYPDVSQSLHIIAQLAHILANLHREEIVHRDLKPENIMMIEKKGDPDYVKLLDFGIARVQSFSHLTETGQVLGTIAYMPPEVIADGEISPAVDIYSLGIIAYEMLTREKPFVADKPLETMKKVISETPPPPIEINPGIPPRLNDLIVRMLAKDPLQRPDAREILAVLVTLS